MIFIDRQIKLMEQSLSTLDVGTLEGFYATRLAKAVINHLRRIRDSGQVNISASELKRLERYWRVQVYD